jgi:hypothetical protein
MPTLDPAILKATLPSLRGFVNTFLNDCEKFLNEQPKDEEESAVRLKFLNDEIRPVLFPIITFCIIYQDKIKEECDRQARQN